MITKISKTGEGAVDLDLDVLCLNKCVLCWILRSNTAKLLIFENKTPHIFMYRMSIISKI